MTSLFPYRSKPSSYADSYSQTVTSRKTSSKVPFPSCYTHHPGRSKAATPLPLETERRITCCALATRFNNSLLRLKGLPTAFDPFIFAIASKQF